MNSHCVLIACVTAVIFTGCDVASNERLPSDGGTADSRGQEPAVRDTRLLGTWYPASGAANYMVVVSNHMLLIYDEDTLDYVEVEVQSNEQPSSGNSGIEGLKRVGRYKHQRTNDRNLPLSFVYDVNGDRLRLIRTSPASADDSVCPSRIEVVRAESAAPERPRTISISARHEVPVGSETEPRSRRL